MKTKASALILFLLIALCASAQTQHGIVKTKGRLDAKGEVIAGTPLENATVVIKGRNAVISDSIGSFSFKVPELSFYLKEVKKNGYELIDLDILAKQFSYSKDNSLYVVMEKPEVQAADKIAAQNKLIRTLNRNLRERQDEIESLVEQNKITIEEYQQIIRDLTSAYDNNVKYISDMAERYSKIDYDQVDDFNRKINELILNGELAKADSLINSKGDINVRKAELLRLKEANQKENEELTQRFDNLAKSKAYEQKELEELAQDCFNKHEIFKWNNRIDSAAYYIETRAELDTTNVQWQLEAGLYISDFLADYDFALEYNQRALRNAIQQFGENHPDVATSYNNIGSVYCSQCDYSHALEYYNKALEIRLKTLGKNHPEVAMSYNNIGVVYSFQCDYPQALKYHNKALEIQLKTLGKKHPDVATTYSSVAIAHEIQGNYSQALKYLNKALEIKQKTLGKNHPDVALIYYIFGNVYSSQCDYPQALEYYNKALEIQLKTFGESHPCVAASYNKIGYVYHSQGDYPKALEYNNKELEIKLKTLGENHPDIALIYYNIGYVYYKHGVESHALEYYTKALEIKRKFYGDDSLETTSNLLTIYSLYMQCIAEDKSFDVQKYRAFMSEVAFTATTDEGDTPALQQGMSGEYYLLEYEDWNQDAGSSVFDKDKKLKGKPKTIVVMKDGVISKHYFEDAIGVEIGLKYVTKAEKAKITAAYNKWKQQNK